jgi:hypothetical protein
VKPRRTAKADARVVLLLDTLDRAFDRPSWHGPNLRNSLRGVGLEGAAWRPQPERHNIWELAVHCAYWKYRIHRLITNGDPSRFELTGSDFFLRPVGASRAAWREDLGLLESWHARLRRDVLALDPERLERRVARSEHTVAGLVAGAAAHDLYHAGQIRLLRRMFGDRD